MIVRLGYVAISNKLGKKATSSSNVTYSNYKKLISDEKKFEKLKTVIISNLNGLEKHIKYNIENNIHICKTLNIPMVLDIHHHNCNNNGENIFEMLEEIFNTWNKEPLPPKIHFSSPREGEFDRKHADYINGEEFVKFINSAKKINRDFDVMLECKEKDIALFKLVDDIKNNYNWIDETTFEV